MTKSETKRDVQRNKTQLCTHSALLDMESTSLCTPGIVSLAAQAPKPKVFFMDISNFVFKNLNFTKLTSIYSGDNSCSTLRLVTLNFHFNILSNKY